MEITSTTSAISPLYLQQLKNETNLAMDLLASVDESANDGTESALDALVAKRPEDLAVA